MHNKISKLRKLKNQFTGITYLQKYPNTDISSKLYMNLVNTQLAACQQAGGTHLIHAQGKEHNYYIICAMLTPCRLF